MFIAVGSNIDPERHIARGLDLLAGCVTVTGVSTFYRSEALRRPQDPPFLNGIVAVETDISPRPLKFDVLRRIEEASGRVRTADAYAPRTLDLDIVMYGDTVVRAPDLEIPDPDLLERPFLAVPLLELAPDLILPDTGTPLSWIVSRMDVSGMTPDPAFSMQLKETVYR